MGEEYKIETTDNTLTFSTRSFRAEQESMLHGGIYNRELTSSLAAGAFIVMFFTALISAGINVTAVYIAVAVAIFAVLFVLFRQKVFRESFLELLIDKAGGVATIVKRQMLSKSESFSLDELAGVESRSVVVSPENPDGIAFVEKIAIQHGTAIPGFGEERRYFTVELVLKDGNKLMVFSTQDEASAGSLAEKLKEFLGAGDA